MSRRAAARKSGGLTISNELHAAQPLFRGRQTGVDPPRQRPDGRRRRIELDALEQPFDRPIELRAVQADIRQRVIVERGQFLVGPAAVPPLGERARAATSILITDIPLLPAPAWCIAQILSWGCELSRKLAIQPCTRPANGNNAVAAQQKRGMGGNEGVSLPATWAMPIGGITGCVLWRLKGKPLVNQLPWRPGDNEEFVIY